MHHTAYSARWRYEIHRNDDEALSLYIYQMLIDNYAEMERDKKGDDGKISIYLIYLLHEYPNKYKILYKYLSKWNWNNKIEWT